MRWKHVVVAGFAVSVMSCLAPTEIILVLSTNVACAVVQKNGIAIALGEPNDEDSGIATTTQLCSDDGGVGTAVLVPHSSIDQPIGIRVTLGIDAAADQCGPKYEGCIVARRSLRFDPHTPLTLPIDLDEACHGIPCTPDSTCVSGACVEAGVECDGSSCGLVDAGIDAAPASCDPVPDVLVAPGAGQGAARVALSNDGWGVASPTPQLGVELRDVHVAGGTTNISIPITLVQGNGANIIGPLGGDGTSYALGYSVGGNLFATIVATDGTSLVTGAFNFSAGEPAHYGMFPLGQGAYLTAYVSNATTDGFVVPFSQQIGANGVGLGLTGVTGISLAHGSSSFIATTADQKGGCAVFKCNYGSTIACSAAGTFPALSCTEARVAERAGFLSHVVESAKVLTVDDIHPLNPAVFGSSFQIVATRDAFHVVWVTNTGGIAIATYADGTTTPMIALQLVPPGTTVIALDAIADGPNQPGWAVAYTAVNAQAQTSVRFFHLCQ